MNAKCINYGQNFLTGKATSILSATGIDIAAGSVKELADAVQDKTMVMVSDLKSTATKEVAKIGSQVGGMAGSLAGTGLSAMQNAFQTTDIIKQSVGEMVSYANSIFDDCTNKIIGMTAAFPSEVTKKATKIASDEAKEELTQLMKEVAGIPAEDHAEKEAKKEKENGINKAVDWCKKAVTNINKFKDDTIGKLQEDCDDISNLMIQGPEWVGEQINTVIDQGKNQLKKFADDSMEDVEDFYDKAVEKSSKALATTMKEKIVRPTIDKAKDQYNKLGTSSNKAKQKAKTAIQKKLFSLAGKLGISPNI